MSLVPIAMSQLIIMLKDKIAKYYFRLWKKYAHPYLLKFKKQQHESEVRLYVHSWMMYLILMQFIHKPYDNWQTFLLSLLAVTALSYVAQMIALPRK